MNMDGERFMNFTNRSSIQDETRRCSQSIEASMGHYIFSGTFDECTS